MQKPSSGQGAVAPRSSYARFSRLVGVSGLLLPIVACGGVAEHAADGHLATAGGSTSASASGAAGAGAGAGAGADSSGGAPNLSVDLPAETGGRPLGAGATEQACGLSAAPSCGLQRSSILIVDGETWELEYPSDSSCGTCRALCEVCTDLKCEIAASGRANCNFFTLQLSACATPDGDPPCLNTAASAPYYLDASGKRWSVELFAGESPTAPDRAELDSDVTLVIRDEVSERTLSAHVQVCAALAQSLVVCK